MAVIEQFFRDLDDAWALALGEKAVLRIIGSSALMLQADYARGTKDSDVLETPELTREIRAELLRLGGRGTALYTRHRLYVEIVANGVPFLPHPPRWHPLDSVNRTLQHLRLEVLDISDVVVSKLKRFHAMDREDVDAMVTGGHVLHADLVSRFRTAVDAYSHDARAGELRKYIANLHQVERDSFGVDESEIELPAWVEE